MNNNIRTSQKDFILMVIGQIISIFGSALLRFSLSLYVLDITGRADLFASLFAISSIPLLLAPLGGAIADRFNRRNLMVIFDFISSIIVFSLFLILSFGHLSVLAIGVIMILLAIVSSLYTPSVTASIPLLVQQNKLESANGIVTGVQALSGVIAPILGGITYGAFGIRTLVIFSGFAFFASAIMEIFIKIPFIKRKQEKHIISTIITDLKDGFVYVIKNTFIRKVAIIATLLNFFLTPFIIVGAPIIFKVTLKGSDIFYGIGMGAIQFATILGALSVGLFAKKLSIKKLYKSFIITALFVLPVAFSMTPFVLNLGFYPAYIVLILCGIVISAICAILSIFVITKVQKETPDENLGKVMAIIMAIAQCATPLGQIIYGILFEGFSSKIYIPIIFIAFIIFALAIFTKIMLKNEGDVQEQ